MSRRRIEPMRDETDPSIYLTCGGLHELTRPEDWDTDRTVWIDTGAGLEQVIYAGHLDVDRPGALVLRSYLPWDDQPTPPATVWALEWAGPIGSTLPATMTAYRSEAGVRAAIAAAAAELGVEPVEDERPGPMRMVMVGELVAMVRSMELLP